MKVFRADYTTFRRERRIRGGGVFVCVKNYITCAELWVDEVYEMIAGTQNYMGNCRHLQSSE